MPDSGRSAKKKETRYPFRMDEGCEVVDSIRIHKTKRSINTNAKSVFKDPNVARHLSELHDKYVAVTTNKAPTNIVFVSKSHYID